MGCRINDNPHVKLNLKDTKLIYKKNTPAPMTNPLTMRTIKV